MTHLSSCYFCGAAGGVEETPVVPSDLGIDAALPPAGDRATVALCETCRDRLDRLLVAGFDGELPDRGGQGQDRPGDDRRGSKPRSGEQGSSHGRTTRNGRRTGGGRGSAERVESRDAGGEVPPSPADGNADGGGDDTLTASRDIFGDADPGDLPGDDAAEASTDDHDAASETSSDSGSSGGGSRTYTTSQAAGGRPTRSGRPTGNSGPTGDPGPGSGSRSGSGSSSDEGSGTPADEGTADEGSARPRDSGGDPRGESTADDRDVRDAATGDDHDARGESTGNAAGSTGEDASDDPTAGIPDEAYNNVVRLLQNREFPVDPGEIVEVATSAYGLGRRDCEAALDALVEQGVLAREEGRLVKVD